jgi:hypothetical protein
MVYLGKYGMCGDECLFIQSSKTILKNLLKQLLLTIATQQNNTVTIIF